MAAPAFSRRHYVAVAAVLSVIADDVISGELTDADETWRAFREGMTVIFSDDNPAFDPVRFREACIPERVSEGGAFDA